MKRTKLSIIGLLTTLILIANISGINAQKDYLNELDKNAGINELTKQEKKAGWKLLFDGKTFENWRGYNMDHVPDCWVIEDGNLKVLAEGKAESNMGLITDKPYKSFVLSIEFKLTPGANSGIIYQVAEDKKYHYPYETGAEYQVIDNDNWKGGLEDWQKTAANYAMYPPKSLEYNPPGEWNHAMIVVDGNKISHFLNGTLVVEYVKHSDEWTNLRNSGKWSNFPDYGKFDTGHIALQNHGAEVYYRNIKIKELD